MRRTVSLPRCYFCSFSVRLAASFIRQSTPWIPWLVIRTRNTLYFGRAAAKLDDLVNYIPARLTGLAFAAAACLIPGMSGKNAFKIWRRDRRNHKSPNSAQSESACAGALGVQLAGDAWYFGELYLSLPSAMPFADRTGGYPESQSPDVCGLGSDSGSLCGGSGADLLYVRTGRYGTMKKQQITTCQQDKRVRMAEIFTGIRSGMISPSI